MFCPGEPRLMDEVRPRAILTAVLILACCVPAITVRGQLIQTRPAGDGIVYYLDGAGGGGRPLDWGRKVEKGLRQGGFRGEFKQFKWQTGLGALVDHGLSESSKRKEARKLALQLSRYMDLHPRTPVYLIGLSAGTAILVFTLEALPEKKQVENVVLLSSSLGADYDLSRALRRVDGQMYVFTSKNDPILEGLVPLVGTAERDWAGRDIAGLKSFQPPAGAGPDTRRQYTKIVHVPWREQFKRFGNRGSHTGATDADFVARYITPTVQPGQEDASADRTARVGTGREYPRESSLPSRR